MYGANPIITDIKPHSGWGYLFVVVSVFKLFDAGSFNLFKQKSTQLMIMRNSLDKTRLEIKTELNTNQTQPLHSIDI